MCACRGGAGFAHVSCLARQAKILVAEAEERDLDDDAFEARWVRWYTCRLCEQQYHGVMRCALSWACWKTYVGRPEADAARMNAINMLGNGLDEADHHEDALSVQEADLAMRRRLGVSEEDILQAQNNLANTYEVLGRRNEALSMQREAYAAKLKLYGEEDIRTIGAAYNVANALLTIDRPEEGKALIRKLTPVARRVLGESHDLTLRIRTCYAISIYGDDSATHDDLREAVNTLDDSERIARRVLGGAHPLTKAIEQSLVETRKRVQT